MLHIISAIGRPVLLDISIGISNQKGISVEKLYYSSICVRESNETIAFIHLYVFIYLFIWSFVS